MKYTSALLVLYSCDGDLEVVTSAIMADGDAPRRPFVEYADDKASPENYVRVCVDIPGLKKKLFGDEASNAAVTFAVQERSFCLTVALENKGKKDKFQYEVKKLPEPILTDSKKTYYKVKKDEVQLFLHKAKPGPWARQLAAVGLETAPEDADIAMD